MESSGVEVLRRVKEDCAENTRSHGSILCKNRIATEVRLVHDGINSRGI